MLVLYSSLQSQAEKLAVLLASNELNKNKLILETKYYSAEIPIQVVSDDDQLEVALNKAEAIIVLVSNTSLDNEDLIILESKEIGDFVRLVVAPKGGDEKIQRKRIDWCLRYGFEFVLIDYENPSPLVDQDDLEMELEGLPRILQALEVNAWSNMVMKGRKTAVAVQASETIPANKADPNLLSTNDITEEEVEDRSEAEERRLDDIGSAMEVALQLRKDVESKKLSDQERRGRAAEMALRLSALMGIEDGDEDSD